MNFKSAIVNSGLLWFCFVGLALGCCQQWLSFLGGELPINGVFFCTISMFSQIFTFCDDTLKLRLICLTLILQSRNSYFFFLLFVKLFRTFKEMNRKRLFSLSTCVSIDVLMTQWSKHVNSFRFDEGRKYKWLPLFWARRLAW